MPPRTLRGLGAAFLAVFVATVLVVGISIYIVTHRTLDREVDRRLASAAAMIQPDDSRPDLATIVQRIGTLERQRESRDLGFMLVDRSGRHVAGTLRIALPPPGFSAIDRDAHIPGLVRGRALMLPVGQDHRLAMIAESEPIDAFDSVLTRVLLIGLGVIVAMVVIGVAMLTGAIGRRIADLRATAEAIMAGDMDRRVPIAGSGNTFDDQAALLNRMLDRIQQLMVGIRHVAHDAAHDLRTPLARLHATLAALARRGEGGVLQAELDDAVAQTEDALRLFTAILRIAEIEGGDRGSDLAPIDLPELVDTIVAAYLPTIEEQGRSIRIIATGEQPLTIRGDARLLNQLFANLIENWLAHTDAGTSATVSVTRQGDAVEAVFADRGAGIAEGDRETAMRRFGRLQAGGGHGLGLPLIAAIARMHQATVTLGDASPGLSVTVRFPGQLIDVSRTSTRLN